MQLSGGRRRHFCGLASCDFEERGSGSTLRVSIVPSRAKEGVTIRRPAETFDGTPTAEIALRGMQSASMKALLKNHRGDHGGFYSRILGNDYISEKSDEP